jgi:Ca-activated chloride channel family protein
MTFLSPIRLLLLLAPLALVGGYLIAQRARHRYAVRFSSVELLASVAPKRPGWQRHVGPAALVFALAILVLGFARPAHAVKVPRQRATVVLALDTSGSMGATDVAPSRLVAAQESARKFIAGLGKGIKVGLISFDSTARVLVTPTTDHNALLEGITNIEIGGGTATGDAVSLALDTINSQAGSTSNKTVPAAVVLMSDGTPTIGRLGESPEATLATAAADAKAAGVPIDTIAFGTPSGTVVVRGGTVNVPSDPSAMAAIAEATNGKTFTAQSASELRSVYSQIGRLVGYDTVTRELTAGFTGIGIALMVAAAAAGLWWTQRFA